MPELPEVESLVRELARPLSRRTVERVRVLKPDVLRMPAAGFARALRGVSFAGVTRRGKNIVLSLHDGRVLLVNLGMTGKLLLADGRGARAPGPPREEPAPEGTSLGDEPAHGTSAAPTHPAVVLFLRGGGALVYDDVRRFGVLELLAPSEWEARSDALGVEPLGRALTEARLHELLLRSRSPVRNWLRDQRGVSGVGNIYASEALHRARVHPARPARSLTPGEAGALLRGLRSVLRAAIAEGGTTLRDYRGARGREGKYGRLLRVYGREGEPCPRCGGLVERCVLSNRSAFFCPSCQPEG